MATQSPERDDENLRHTLQCLRDTVRVGSDQTVGPSLNPQYYRTGVDEKLALGGGGNGLKRRPAWVGLEMGL